MFHAFDCDQGVGHSFNLRAFALHNQDLQAVIVIEMHVHSRHNMTLKVVLDVRELSGKVSNVVIVHKRDRRDRFPVSFVSPFLAHELISDEIPQRLGPRRVLATPNHIVEVVE